MSPKSRAEYMKKRREKFRQFSVLVEKEKMDALDETLKEQDKTKAKWLNEKIDEELGE